VKEQTSIIENIDKLCVSITSLLTEFQDLKKWTGPSAYFHEKTLGRLEELGGAVTAIGDRQYQEYLYATLCAWGLHRMGEEYGRLVEFDKFCQELRSLTPHLGKLQELRLEELTPEQETVVGEYLWGLIESLRIRPLDKTYLVPASKALHHLLPNLVVPIDDKHTGEFFQWPSNWRNRQRDCFFQVFPSTGKVARRIKPNINAYIGISKPFHRSLPKLIDNAIVAFENRGDGSEIKENSPSAQVLQPDQTKQSATSYITYENTHNPHVTIHRAGCGQIGKHGGKHKHKQGKYLTHNTYSQARSYAVQTGLQVIDCSWCKP